MGVIQGVIHGKTIELTTDPGLPDGVTVEVVVRTTKNRKEAEEALRETAGSLADIPGLEESMQEILDERKTGRFRELGE